MSAAARLWAQCFQCILSPSTPQTHFTDEYHCISLQTPPAAFPSAALISWCSAANGILSPHHYGLCVGRDGIGLHVVVFSLPTTASAPP